MANETIMKIEETLKELIKQGIEPKEATVEVLHRFSDGSRTSDIEIINVALHVVCRL